jgi:hypothetical protein
MQDLEFRREFERELGEITTGDAVVNALSELRSGQRKSKAELVGEVGKTPRVSGGY